MANIKVAVEKTIADGYKLKFRTPCDSTAIEGLDVKYPSKGGIGTLIKKFVFKDAHGTELSGVGNLFVGGVMIEVLLDVTHGVAYIQNADTNSYVESVKGEIKRLEEAQKQFLSVAGEVVEDYEQVIKSCEQALTATENATEAANQATNTLVLTHNDLMNGGYIKTIKELNAGNKLTFWIGTMDEYNAIPEKVNNCLYITTDDVTMGDIREEVESAIETLNAEIEAANAEIETLNKAVEKKAPAGYGGFGETVPNLGVFETEKDLETALLNELEHMEKLQTKRLAFLVKNISGVDASGYLWVCSLCVWEYNYVTLNAESCYAGGVTRITKSLINGEWQPFEWENPPMAEGVEYRTTERDGGDPVYVKMVEVSVPVINDTYGVPDVIDIGEREYVFLTDITGVVYKTDDGTANTSASVSWDLSHVSVKLHKDTYDGQTPSGPAQSFKMTITNNSVDETPAYARITIKYVRVEG